MALTSGATHVLQWLVQREARPRGGANLQNQSQFGLESAIRLHEVGIASNRGSACRGEYVPGPCTHRPSHHESQLYQKSLDRKSTRLNSSHVKISYAVFCLKKKNRYTAHC